MGLPSGLFPSGLPTKTLYASLLSPVNAYLHHTLNFPLNKCEKNHSFSQIIRPDIWKQQLYVKQDGVVAQVCLYGVLFLLISSNVISLTICINLL
jgi:hypothetical protein